MHGSPTSKWDNKDLWITYDYRDFGIVGEPYFDFLNAKHADNTPLNREMLYFTDTARMWDGDKYNVRDKVSNQRKVFTKIHSTFDFIDWLNTKPTDNILMITTHPQRWTNSTMPWIKELIMQTLKNYVKRWIIRR